jgi:hypothetical protein
MCVYIYHNQNISQTKYFQYFKVKINKIIYKKNKDLVQHAVRLTPYVYIQAFPKNGGKKREKEMGGRKGKKEK